MPSCANAQILPEPSLIVHKYITGHVVQSVTCLTADPGVASSIPAWSHTFAEIDHEIISTVILLPSADTRRVDVSYKRKYVHKVLLFVLFDLILNVPSTIFQLNREGSSWVESILS